MIDYGELSEEQRRQLVDIQQVFAASHPASMELESSPRLYWNTSKGRRYLYEQQRNERRSLGRETEALAQQKRESDARIKSLRARVRSLDKRLAQMAPVNKAHGLGRVPLIAARIIRELDREGLLGEHIVVAGTNALFAYEIAAGVLIGGGYVATGDADLVWDTRQSLLLSAKSVVRREGLMGILRRVDPTFTADYGLIARNDRGYIVDLIVAESDDIPIMRPQGDLEAVAMSGIEWLLAAPQFEHVAVGSDGLPLRIVVPEPRTFALHKYWVSQRPDRTPIKRVKDIAHARILGGLAQSHLALPLSAKEMPWLPKDLKSLIPTLKGLIDAKKETP